MSFTSSHINQVLEFAHAPMDNWRDSFKKKLPHISILLYARSFFESTSTTIEAPVFKNDPKLKNLFFLWKDVAKYEEHHGLERDNDPSYALDHGMNILNIAQQYLTPEEAQNFTASWSMTQRDVLPLLRTVR